MAGKDMKSRKSFLSLRSEVMELGSSASGFECDGYLSEGLLMGGGNGCVVETKQ